MSRGLPVLQKTSRWRIAELMSPLMGPVVNHLCFTSKIRYVDAKWRFWLRVIGSQLTEDWRGLMVPVPVLVFLFSYLFLYFVFLYFFFLLLRVGI